MRRKDYEHLLAQTNGFEVREAGLFIPVGYSSISHASWYTFGDKPSLRYAEVSIIMQPGVNETNGADWYESQYQIALAESMNPIQQITQVDLPYHKSKSQRSLSREQILEIYHRHLTTRERSITLSKALARIVCKLDSVANLPYALRFSDIDDSYYEFHCMSYAELEVYQTTMDYPGNYWDIPYEIGSTETLQYGWTMH